MIIRNLNEMKRKGRRVMGCFPLYPPLELFHSMDLVPVVLWGLKNCAGNYLAESDRHIQSYTCSVARHLTAFVLSDPGKYLEGIFMYNAGDTLRNLPEILETGLAEQGRSIPFLKMHIPMVPLSQTDAREYLRNEVSRLIEELEKRFHIRFTEKAFEKSIDFYREGRNRTQQLEERVAVGDMGFNAFAQITMETGFLPVEEQIKIFDSRLKRPVGRRERRKGKGRIMLSGILPPPPAVTEIMEEANLRVACNDLAALYRSYAYMPPVNIVGPLDYYEDFYLNHFPCSTLIYSADRRVEAILDLAKQREVDGVVFIGEKFCEYEYFDFPHLKKQLEQNGLRTLHLEFAVDDDKNVETFRTRIEAFAEMLDTSS